MGTIAHPVKDFSQLFDTINARLKALETPPGPALGTLLASGVPTQSAVSGSASALGTPAPPFGGEVALSTLSFTLTRAAQVMLIAVYEGFVNVSAGPFVTNDGFYFSIDAINQSSQFGTLPKGEPTASTGGSFTLVLIASLAVGAHTVKLIWNSQEGATDKITGSGSTYALLLS
jgi:hypothetical protein